MVKRAQLHGNVECALGKPKLDSRRPHPDAQRRAGTNLMEHHTAASVQGHDAPESRRVSKPETLRYLLPHEVGHVLLGPGHVTSTTNLMCGGSPSCTTTFSRRLTPDQIYLAQKKAKTLEGRTGQCPSRSVPQ